MAARKDSKKDNKTIEEIFEELEEILRKLEEGGSTLEESFSNYEIGIKLIKSCNEKIEKVEKQILVLEGEGEEEGHEL